MMIYMEMMDQLNFGFATPSDFRRLRAGGLTVAEIARQFKVSERTVRAASKHADGRVCIHPSVSVDELIARKQKYEYLGHDVTPSYIIRAMGAGQPPARTADDVRATQRRQFIDRERKRGLPEEWILPRADRLFY